MIRLLFVCLGNICRSPMAEFVMRALAEQSGHGGDFLIRSAATSGEEVGNPVYPPARRKLAEHGIDCAGKTARRLTREDYGAYDLIVGMERANLRAMTRIFGGDPDGKLRLLLDGTAHPHDVADPWYTGDFETAWQDIYTGCSHLLETLIREKSR